MDGKFVSYLRVSTDRQGKSGLGLEAQRQAVNVYLNGGDWKLLGEKVEVESGKVVDRPQLLAALELCKLTGATLVVAKLDRLSRDAHFLLGLQKADVKFVAVDMPRANNFTVGIMALVAQQEREAISRRTKEALAQSKKKLGGWRGKSKVSPQAGLEARQAKAKAFAQRVRPTITALHEDGLSLRKIAAELEARGICTPRGGKWTANAVSDLLRPE